MYLFVSQIFPANFCGNVRLFSGSVNPGVYTGVNPGIALIKEEKKTQEEYLTGKHKSGLSRESPDALRASRGEGISSNQEKRDFLQPSRRGKAEDSAAGQMKGDFYDG